MNERLPFRVKEETDPFIQYEGYPTMTVHH